MDAAELVADAGLKSPPTQANIDPAVGRTVGRGDVARLVQRAARRHRVVIVASAANESSPPLPKPVLSANVQLVTVIVFPKMLLTADPADPLPVLSQNCASTIVVVPSRASTPLPSKFATFRWNRAMMMSTTAPFTSGLRQ